MWFLASLMITLASLTIYVPFLLSAVGMHMSDTTNTTILLDCCQKYRIVSQVLSVLILV